MSYSELFLNPEPNVSYRVEGKKPISKVFGVLAWVFAILVGIAVAVFINRMQKRAENRIQVDAAEERIRRERAEHEEHRAAHKAQRRS